GHPAPCCALRRSPRWLGSSVLTPLPSTRTAPGPGRVIGVLLAVLGFAVFLLVYVFPLYWLVVTSLKGKAELYAAEIPLFPLNPTLEAYADVLVARSFGVLLRNSIIVCLATVATTLALGLLITYPLTRLDIPRGVRVGVLN